MTRGHSLSSTVNNSSAMQTEPNCEKAESFLATRNNYAVLKILHVRKAQSTDNDEE